MGDRVGQRLGNYRVIRLLGKGGFGDVYLGEHIHLNTQVAIKVLQTRLVRSNLEQFRVEAQTIARLVHPHIVRILDFGVEDDIPFLVMDYAPNGILRQRHPKGIPVPAKSVVAYVKQVAAALQYAHDRKLIHRDIKPENMLLGLNGDVLLSDFGLVLIAQSTGSRTTKEVAGTIPYMAPEQINGKPRPASDQYALGIVIYEWLSGERPFNGSFVEIATQHLMIPPAALYGRVADVSPAMEEVVFTALAKDPQQRYASVQALAIALEQACERTQAPLPVSPLPMTSSDQSSQPTYVVAPPGQALQSIFVVSPSSQLSESTYVVTPPNQQVLSGDAITPPQQPVQQEKISTSSNPMSRSTKLVTQAGRTREEPSIDQSTPQKVDNSQLSTMSLDRGLKSANPASTRSDDVLQLKKRIKSIISVAVFAGAGLILVCSALLILNLWYPNILRGTYANASSLSAVFPALYFGVPLLTSGIVVCLMRLAIGISKRTGVASRTVLWQGSLLLMLFGVLTLWHPMVGMSSAEAINLPVNIAGIMLLISGIISFLIAITMTLGNRGLNRDA
jgi:serine/threonine protein kinase